MNLPHRKANITFLVCSLLLAGFLSLPFGRAAAQSAESSAAAENTGESYLANVSGNDRQTEPDRDVSGNGPHPSLLPPDGSYEEGYDPAYYQSLPFRLAAPKKSLFRMKALPAPGRSSLTAEGSSTGFGFEQAVREYTAPEAGIYKLEAWGAQGGSEGGIGGGNGGYAYGYLQLEKGDKLYLCVGGAGSDAFGGYNGGASGEHSPWDGGWRSTGAGGGGATSITRTNRGTLTSFDGYRSEVYLVAAGGGGNYHVEGAAYFDTEKDDSQGTPGGGLTTKGFLATNVHSKLGRYEGTRTAEVMEVNQTAGYRFGAGEGRGRDNGAGGGGWYGGYARELANRVRSGGGGSSYIGGLPAFTFGGTTYENGTASGSNSGNGSARITFVRYALKATRTSPATVEKIERQKAVIEAEVISAETVNWEQQKTEGDAQPAEDKWTTLQTGTAHHTVRDTLQEGRGTVSLEIITTVPDDHTWYRLRVQGKGRTVYSEPSLLQVIPLKADHLICDGVWSAEAGDLFQTSDFPVQVVYNNPEVIQSVQETPVWAEQLFFLLTDGSMEKMYRFRTVSEEYPVTLHLVQEDKPADVTIRIAVRDRKAPVITGAKAEQTAYVALPQEKTLHITVTAEDQSDGILTYYLTGKDGEKRSEEQTDGNFSVSFQQNEVLLIHVRDESGNESVLELPVVYVDSEKPVIQELTKSYDGWTNQSLILTVHASDALSGLAELAYSIDSGKNWQKENTFPIRENGTYTVLVRDLVGNTAEASLTVFTIDHTAPVIEEVDCTPEKDWTEGDAEITVKAADHESGLPDLAYSFDGGETWQARPFLRLHDSSESELAVRDIAGNTARLHFTVTKKLPLSAAVEQILPQKKQTPVRKAQTVRHPEIIEELTVEVTQEEVQPEQGRVQKKEGIANRPFTGNAIILSAPDPWRNVSRAAAGAAGAGGLGLFGFMIWFCKCRINEQNRAGEETYYGARILRRRGKAYLIRIGEPTEHFAGLSLKLYFAKRFLQKNSGKLLILSFHDKELEQRIKENMVFQIH